MTARLLTAAIRNAAGWPVRSAWRHRGIERLGQADAVELTGQFVVVAAEQQALLVAVAAR